jgi:hypothetical protein
MFRRKLLPPSSGLKTKPIGLNGVAFHKAVISIDRAIGTSIADFCVLFLSERGLKLSK